MYQEDSSWLRSASNTAEHVPSPLWQVGAHEPIHAPDPAFTDLQLVTIRSLHASLGAHPIDIEIPGIGRILLEAIATLPAFCRKPAAE
jgi:hypothetical protein